MCFVRGPSRPLAGLGYSECDPEGHAIGDVCGKREGWHARVAIAKSHKPLSASREHPEPWQGGGCDTISCRSLYGVRVRAWYPEEQRVRGTEREADGVMGDDSDGRFVGDGRGSGDVFVREPASEHMTDPATEAARGLHSEGGGDPSAGGIHAVGGDGTGESGGSEGRRVALLLRALPGCACHPASSSAAARLLPGCELRHHVLAVPAHPMAGTASHVPQHEDGTDGRHSEDRLPHY